MNLKGKKIILGITGSIAAYKTPHLVRLLRREGAEVRVLATESAADFVSLLSLSTVSGHPVAVDIADGDAWNNHVELGRWADLMILAPCSANTMAKMAHGLCDQLVLAVYLSATCPVWVAPAMDEDMWHHPTTRENLRLLRTHGVRDLPVGYGDLASGLVGQGRMAEPEQILDEIIAFFEADPGSGDTLEGKRVLITAGPTYEKLDPVRFIGNFSTGKMGLCLAEEWAARGAEVDLVMGPSALEPRGKGIRLHRVVSAQEMHDQALALFAACDLAIMAAAVSDYRPATAAPRKIKKTRDTLDLSLVRNPDILARLGSQKREDQLVVGFALETDHGLENAQKKRRGKKADLIVLNSLEEEGAGFGLDTNKVTLVPELGPVKDIPLGTKEEVAREIVNYIVYEMDFI